MPSFFIFLKKRSHKLEEITLLSGKACHAATPRGERLPLAAVRLDASQQLRDLRLLLLQHLAEVRVPRVPRRHDRRRAPARRVRDQLPRPQSWLGKWLRWRAPPLLYEKAADPPKLSGGVGNQTSRGSQPCLFMVNSLTLRARRIAFLGVKPLGDIVLE